MLRVHSVSDLHVDIEGNSLKAMPATDADVTIVAGDAAAPGSEALKCVRELFPDTSRPLIYTPGNHDYYSFHDKNRPHLKTTFERERERMRETAAHLGIILLDDGVAVINGVRFVGGTGWTDFEARPPYMPFDCAVREAARRMNDYRCIKVGEGRSRDTLRPKDSILAHRTTRRFLEEALSTPFDGETVVITHHAPCFRSLRQWDPERPNRFMELDWCYASDLEFLMHGETAPVLWIHGHIHENRDYEVGGTRIVANPRGYPRENLSFDSALVIDVEPRLTPSMKI